MLLATKPFLLVLHRCRKNSVNPSSAIAVLNCNRLNNAGYQNCECQLMRSGELNLNKTYLVLNSRGLGARQPMVSCMVSSQATDGPQPDSNSPQPLLGSSTAHETNQQKAIQLERQIFADVWNRIVSLFSQLYCSFLNQVWKIDKN